MRIVVMGVAGSGKTTIGTDLAERLGHRFVDADAVHPPANVAKMAAGVPLTDDDRQPWLEHLRDELRAGDVVITCSALRRRYRDLLRTAGAVRFVFLDVDPDTARARTGARTGHFMKAAMVTSQFETLERPTPDETDVVTVDADAARSEILDAVLATLLRARGDADDDR